MKTKKMINQNVIVGINAVKTLRGRTEPTRVEDLAQEIGTTLHFLEQITRKLKLAGILNVKRGPGGGYTVDPLVSVTAYSVAKAVGPDLGVVSLDEAPASKLHRALVEAYQGVQL